MCALRLYFLLPESDPCNDWMMSNDTIQQPESVTQYLKKLSDLIRHTSFDDFEGFYDSANVINCLSHFEILGDYYPMPVTKIVRGMFSKFEDWSEIPFQSAQSEYKIHHNPIVNHTFCENAECANSGTPSAVVHVDAHQLGSPFEVELNGIPIAVESLENFDQIAEWFKNNRNPARNFQISDKHGENRQDVRMIGRREVHPFRSSFDEGKALVASAIGFSKKEIFNYEEDKGFVVFKYEGDNPQQMYHAYHVPENSIEVPSEIRAVLSERLKEKKERERS